MDAEVIYLILYVARGFESHLGLMGKGMGAKRHTACRPGKKVFIKLVDGRKFVDIFEDRKGGTIFLKNNGKFEKWEIRSFCIYKEMRI